VRVPIDHARWYLPVAFAIVLVGLWQLAVTATGTNVVPGPWKVVRGLGELADKGLLVRYTLDSLRRVAIGSGVLSMLHSAGASRCLTTWRQPTTR